MPRTVHVIGAGLAGLSAAVRLATRGASVVVHEAAGQAGGRCRSYFDPRLGMMIDNGNHLLLSGNHAALAYLETIGADGRLAGPDRGRVPVRRSRKRRALDACASTTDALPWWIFDREPPRARHACARLSCLRAAAVGRRGKTIGDDGEMRGPLYERLVRPLLLAALNTEPREASAASPRAVVRETLAAGGKACRPLIARDGLGHAFIEPALRFLARAQREGRSSDIGCARSISRHDRSRRSISARTSVALGDDDGVILAVPPWWRRTLVPGLETPSNSAPSSTRISASRLPPGSRRMLGIVNGTIEWVFAFPDRLVGHDQRRRPPARRAARDAGPKRSGRRSRRSTGCPRRCRHGRSCASAARPSPRRPARMPSARLRDTAWSNLLLAGDWTETGLPATIEGAIRSGNRAADLVVGQ